MKIAIVHYSFPPVIGGVEKIAAQQARLFVAHGHEVTLLCESGGIPEPGCHVVHYARGPEESVRLDALLPVLAEQALVIVHNVCTMPFDPVLTTVLWAAAETLPAVRFVCWIHDISACNPDYRPPSLGDPRWGRLGTAQPHFEYIAVSMLRASQWHELTGAPCRVIPNGVDPAALLGFDDAFAAWESEHSLLNRDFVLLHPARLLHRKNIELGLRVTAAIKGAGRSCAYLLTAAADPHHAASASYASDLRSLRRELGLEGEALFAQEHRAITDRDLPHFYAAADALFFPSRQEGFGLPMLEAALHRLPIFCADIEPLRDLPGYGVTRFSLDADPTQIADSIMRQLDASPAIQARKAVLREYSWPAVYRNFLAPLLLEAVIPPIS